MVECLPLLHRIDQLVWTAASPTSLMDGGGLSSEANPLSARPISAIMPLGGVHSSSVESSEDSKEGVIFDIRCMHAKRKVVMAMGELVTGVPNIAKRIQTRRSFSCLLNSIASAPTGEVVISDDDIQQFRGISGACNQPIVSSPIVSSIPVQTASLAPVKVSPSKDHDESD